MYICIIEHIAQLKYGGLHQKKKKSWDT